MARRALVLIAAVLIGVGFLAPTAQAQYNPGQPGFILTPSTTPPEQPVTAVGFGCPAGPVEIYVGETLVTTTVTVNDGKGTFQATFPAPPIAGQYVVTVKCGNIIMTNILNVILEATLTVTPTALACGNQTDLVATGYQPETTVTFYLDATVLGTATADSRGIARLTAVIPTSTAVGAHQVRSSGASQLQGEQLDMVQDLTVSSCPTTLPVTGGDSMTYVRSGLALVGLGGLVLLAARRRREA